MSYRSSRSRRYEARWPEYVPVAERRRRAAAEMEKLRKKGHPVSPVTLEGKKIATTFWGKAWCDNLERYADFANRIERGRTYVRNGSVVDLQIAPRKVTAMVSGSSLYKITVDISEVPNPHWATICRDCAGGIDSLVELLQGRFSTGVMERICRQGDGLFPKPTEIRFKCSCPDGAYMCKHIAAVLYGVGARLDQKPELLFRLRAVDENELVARIDSSVPLTKSGRTSRQGTGRGRSVRTVRPGYGRRGCPPGRGGQMPRRTCGLPLSREKRVANACPQRPDRLHRTRMSRTRSAARKGRLPNRLPRENGPRRLRCASPNRRRPTETAPQQSGTVRAA